jgi:hypothetical protein
MDIKEVLIQIEDDAVPRLKLDLGEARLYYHLIRHSRLIDTMFLRKQAAFLFRNANTGHFYSILAA